MAFDEITERVQRQERPILTLPKFNKGSRNGNIIIHGADSGSFNGSLLLSSVSVSVDPRSKSFSFSRPTSPMSSSAMGSSLPALPALWPPLKGQKYCKKQIRRSSKRKGLSSSMMYLYEGSINQKRLSTALNDLSFSSDDSLLFSKESTHISHHQNHFWSKQVCHEFWDKYLECDLNIVNSSELMISNHSSSVVPVNEMEGLNLNYNDYKEGKDTISSDPFQCYTKINRSIRKLLRKTFNGAANFAELENIIINPSPFVLSNCFHEFGFGHVLVASDSNITVKLDTPFHRVWLHAICQYHGHLSQSKSVDQDRLVHITFKYVTESPPSCSLYEFLTRN